MTRPIGPSIPTVPIPGAAPIAGEAAQMLRGAMHAGVRDTRYLAAGVVQSAEQSPHRAADLLEQMKSELSVGERNALAQDVAEGADALGEQQRSLGGRSSTLLLDMGQLALSIAGIFDPTPTCDAIDGMVCLLRRDYQGAAISAVSMIPYMGDFAKTAKLGKLVGVVSEASELAKSMTTLGKHMLPDVTKARAALDARCITTGDLRQGLDNFPTVPSTLDLMYELRSATRERSGPAAGTASRLEDLQPDRRIKEASDNDKPGKELFEWRPASNIVVYEPQRAPAIVENDRVGEKLLTTQKAAERVLNIPRTPPAPVVPAIKSVTSPLCEGNPSL